MRSSLLFVSLSLLTLISCAHQPATAPLSAGAQYVAMGSSFAAGPFLGEARDTLDPRCLGSVENYPHQLARRLQLTLIDVSCSGAATKHILGPWAELPAQLDAVTPATRLVTITIGGNDVGYTLHQIMSSCAQAGPNPDSKWGCKPIPSVPTNEAFAALEERLVKIALKVRDVAPEARVFFVTYATVLPQGQLCDRTPMRKPDATLSREIASRLAETTRLASARAGVGLIDAAALTQAHHACSQRPLVTGYLKDDGSHERMPYHPNREAMAFVAEALSDALN